MGRWITLGTVPVGVSNRHVHLSEAALEKLFGPGYELRVRRELSQPGQFAAEETVTLVGPKGCLSGVRILGPARRLTQVEISRTDGYALGVHPPVRLSGDIRNTPGIAIVGPRGALSIDEGVIVAARHIHMAPADAQRFGVRDGQRVWVRAETDRPVIFENVVIRVREDFALDFHIDLDEANAAFLRTGDRATVLTMGDS
ncbi:MAG: phosphate propanoyltransferase [Firmicutes bacterium]|nr:phosphate propanoyltransferase [Bacillota bacterium]